MISTLIQRRIRQVRTRERLVRLCWGACRVAALALTVIFVGCMIDWLWDRTQDTPMTLRQILLCATALAAGVGVLVWILLPLIRPLDDDDLALRVEETQPRFQHRLISAVQLNRPHADRRGMSEELIVIVTEEAESITKETSFFKAVDHGRLGRGLKWLLPVAAACGVAFLLWPQLVSTLLARHFLDDVDIPRKVQIEPFALNDVRPAGERVSVKFRVRSTDLDPALKGHLWVTPDGMPSDKYPLTFLEKDADGETAIFAADVAPSTIDFTYTARLGDGRLRRPGSVKMVARPAVLEQVAWTVLPEYCGTTPSGQRYEQLQPRGDIIGIAGSSGKVYFKTQKAITKATLETVGPMVFPPKDGVEPGPEVPRRQVPCDIDADGLSAIGTFDLKPDETGYRILVEDEYGFGNVPPPRRGVRIVAEDAPTVVLLKDYFTPGRVGPKESLEDFFVEGMPVPIGETIRVPYLAEGPYGLGQAWLLYRVIRKAESGNDVVEDGPWKRIPLTEVLANNKSGPFDLRRGVFETTPPEKGVDFHAIPSDDPETKLGRILGGGRFHFKTSGIPDGKGGTLKLNEGDKIEYCIEIHADKGKNPNRPVARSDTRVQTLGSYETLGRWVSDFAQEERRLREIDSKQRTLFGSP